MNPRSLLGRLAEEKREGALCRRREALLRLRLTKIEREELELMRDKCVRLMNQVDPRVIHPYIAKMESLKK